MATGLTFEEYVELKLMPPKHADRAFVTAGVKMIIDGIMPAWVAECVSNGHGPDGTGKAKVYNRARLFAFTGHRVVSTVRVAINTNYCDEGLRYC
jgi:hypothetical protein